MKAEPAFTRSSTIVPPERVMTRLMPREERRPRDRYRVDYLILAAFAVGVLLGVFLALRG